MTQLPIPNGRQEFHDGNNWYSLASENWTLNQLRIIKPCLVTTTLNLNGIYDNASFGVGATLTNNDLQKPLVIDGITLSVGDRVLVKNQTIASENGIYAVTNSGSFSSDWILTRSNDYDSVVQIIRGDTIAVIQGDTSSASIWMLVSTVTAIGNDSFSFAKTDQNSFTSIVGTDNQLKVSVENGIATISLVDNPILPGKASVKIPTGSTLDRPMLPEAGMLRFNTSL